MVDAGHPFAVMYNVTVKLMGSCNDGVGCVWLPVKGLDAGQSTELDLLHGVLLNFGDTCVPRDKIVRKIQGMGSEFEVRNGCLLYARNLVSNWMSQIH